MHLKNGMIGILFLWCVSSACGSFSVDSDPESVFLLTMLGKDTIAVETFTFQGEDVHATVLTRTPQTSLVRYHLQMDEQKRWRQLTEQHLYPGQTRKDSILRQRKLSFTGDSLLIIETQTIRRINRAEIKVGPDILPYQDMVYWPYQVVLRRMREEGKPFFVQDLISGQRLLTFEISRRDSANFIIRHPTRGNMVATLGEDGRLSELNAESSTRKLRVARVPAASLKLLAADYSKREREGEGLGALSGRGHTEKEINGAQISIDYGRPAKRGRRLFGDLVPWGEVWRTGANMATHFATDTTLLFGGQLEVPPGEYTLFTIPKADGGDLILNKQTGQNGRSYDAGMNLGTVPMELVPSTGDRELFTIDVRPATKGGILELIWGNTKFEVEFQML